MLALSKLSRIGQCFKRDSRISCPLAAGAVAIAASYMYSQRHVSTETSISVMTWNVLARPYTKYNAKFHHSAKGGKGVEDQNQTIARYTLAGKRIVREAADLVFLQECEADFFNAAWNGAADQVLEDYFLFPCWMQSNPGTVVLVKKSSPVTADVSKPACIGGSQTTGGLSKVATVLPVSVGSRRFAAVSTHFTWDGAAGQRTHHAKLIGDGLSSCSGVVLGGDFNCQPGERLKELESATFLKNMERAAMPPGTPTGLNSDFSEKECIDHVYISKEFRLHSIQALETPSSPWSGEPVKVVKASDHVPVLARMSWG